MLNIQLYISFLIFGSLHLFHFVILFLFPQHVRIVVYEVLEYSVLAQELVGDVVCAVGLSLSLDEVIHECIVENVFESLFVKGSLVQSLPSKTWFVLKFTC